ncbi:MAG: porin family protein [Aquirufa sp.]
MKKITLLLLLIFSVSSVFAQKSKYKRVFHEYYDARPLHFGFLFGLAGSSYNYVALNSGSDVILSPKHFGFQIGGVANYAFNRHIELKTGINVALFERHLDYYLSTNIPIKSGLQTDNLNYLRESTWLEIPVSIKFRSIRRKNHRFFVLAGAKFGIEANTRDKDFSSLSSDYNHTIYAKKSDLALEYGFGFEQFFQFFKFAPEIRFSHGIFNIYQAPTTSDPVAQRLNEIKHLNTHTVSLILNFE